MILDGITEIALHQIHHIAAKLDQDIVVQAKPFPKSSALGRCGFLAHHCYAWITRHGASNDKCHEQNADEYRNQ